MIYNALIDDATLAVLSYGFTTYDDPGPGQTEVALNTNPRTRPVDGIELEHNKIVVDVFVEMSQAEKDVVDAANIPANETAVKAAVLSDPLDDHAVTAVVAGLQITTNIEGLVVVDDITTVVADPTNTKLLRISYIYNSATDTFSLEAYEKTTGAYDLYSPPEYLVKEIGEWSVVANGTTLIPV